MNNFNARNLFCVTLLFLMLFLATPVLSQKVLQIEQYGKAKTKKIHVGERIFIKTKQSPDVWFEAEIEDMIIDAQALVFYDRIIVTQDIVKLKFKKKSFFQNLGKSFKYSGIVPVTYELIYGAVNPPIQWESMAWFVGSSFVIGSAMEFIPPKRLKFGNRKRLRILDLTFYP